MQLCAAVVALFLIHGLAHGAEIAGNDLVEKAKAEGEVEWYSTLPLPETQAWGAQLCRGEPTHAIFLPDLA